MALAQLSGTPADDEDDREGPHSPLAQVLRFNLRFDETVLIRDDLVFD